MPLNQKLLREVINLSRSVGSFIKEEQVSEKEVEVKSKNSLVTYVDKTAEKRIVNKLSELIPQAGFIAEEGTSDKKGEEWNWIIDPLDGTTNFIHKLPCYSISIALMKNNEIVLGVVYEINNDECFYSIKGDAAYLNGEKIRVSPTGELKDTLIATGFPYHDYSKIDGYMKTLRYFMRETRGLRRMGSAAVDLVYVACGRFDGFYEYSLNPWDVAAGAFIVQQAGGVVSDFKGGNNFLFGKEIVASSSNISNTFSEIIVQNL